MNAFEAQNKKSEKDLQREAVVELVGRFNKNETPYSLQEMQDLSSGIETEWREGGYSKAASFVGQEGDLVMLARKQRDAAAQPPMEGQSDELRFLFDGRVVDVTIPSEMKSKELNFRDGSVKIYDTSQVDENSLPEYVRQLVKKFGNRMSITTESPRQEMASLNDDYYDLQGIVREAQRQQDEHAKTEQEAYDIENNAKIAAGLVKKKLFMTAQKHTALQDEAYRASIRTATAPKGK